jgi:hypothetical protein
LREYTEKDPVCKHCGIPYSLEIWTFAYTYASGLFFIFVFFLLSIILPVVLPLLNAYIIYLVSVLSFIALFWFSWRFTPYSLSDIVINYERAKTLVVEDNISKLMRLRK